MARIVLILMVIAGLGLTIAAFGPGLTKGAVGEVGGAAPDFQLYSTRGKLVQLSAHRGKVIVLDFWASWCPPCRAAIPAMHRLNERYHDQGVLILGVNVRDNQDPAEFMSKMNATYPVLISGEDVATEYSVKGIPTFVIIDKQGKVIYRDSGWTPAREQEIRRIIEDAIAAP